MNAREGIGGNTSAGYSRNASSSKAARAIVYACAVLLAVLMITAMPEKPACAAEGGASSFTPGAQGDFAICYMPAGVYWRNNIIYTEGTLDNYPAAVTNDLGVPATAYAKLDSKVWFDLLQVVNSTNFNILGGRYFCAINIPIVMSQKLETDISFHAAPELGTVASDSNTTTGLGDIQAVPFGILWDKDSLHFLAAQNIVLDTGRYSEDKSNNVGRNYFSYDELLGVTWLDETGGHEVSVLAGYMFNTRNQATNYKTGDEFHLDYTLAQYLSKNFGLGITGYYYKQMTDDESPTLDAINAANEATGVSSEGGFKSEGSAVGPAIMYTHTIAGKDVNFIAKWLHEYNMENRLEGEWVYLSGVVKF